MSEEEIDLAFTDSVSASQAVGLDLARLAGLDVDSVLRVLKDWVASVETLAQTGDIGGHSAAARRMAEIHDLLAERWWRHAAGLGDQDAADHVQGALNGPAAVEDAREPDPSPDRWFIAVKGGLHYGVKITVPRGIDAPYRPIPMAALRETDTLAAAGDAGEVLAPDGVLMWPVGRDVYEEWTRDEDDDPDEEDGDEPYDDEDDDGPLVETVRPVGDVL